MQFGEMLNREYVRKVFVARSQRKLSTRRLAKSVSELRFKNSECNVTGCLILQGRYSLFVLEGEAVNVEPRVHDMLDADTLEIRDLWQVDISDRAFGSALACVDISQLAPEPGMIDIKRFFKIAAEPEIADLSPSLEAFANNLPVRDAA